MKPGLYKLLILLFILTAFPVNAGESTELMPEEASGLELMQEIYRRHQQFSFIYEEQSMVMIDRNGDRDTRKARRYSRVEEDGSVKFLLLFDSPEEINGVALLANRDALGNTKKYIYLPAFGEQLLENMNSGKEGKFLGTDFTIESIVGETLEDYFYVRKHDKIIEGVEYFIIDVLKIDDGMTVGMMSSERFLLRRHYIRKDNLYITKTEYFDHQGNIYKKQSHHDLKPVDGEMWRADMILMEDSKENHQSLIKITRRVFSRDYVSAEIFTEDWLFKNQPFISPADTDDENNIPEDEDAIEMPEVIGNSSDNIETG